MKKILPLLLVLILIALMLFMTKVSNISLNQNECISENDLNVKGKFILTISSQKIEEELKNNHPCISQVTVSKSFPSKIVIDVKSDDYAAQIANTALVITSNGLLVEKQVKNLPILFLPQGIVAESGKIITDPTVKSASKIASLIDKTDFHAVNIRIISANEIAAYNSEETLALFSSYKSEDVQVDSLQQVLARTKISPAQGQENEPKIAKIDLRFEKPIISQ